MRFDSNSLQLSSRAFFKALKRKGIVLKPTSAYSAWSRGLSGRNYSSLYSELESAGAALKIDNIKTVMERLKTALEYLGTSLSINEVIGLFSESTKDCLTAIDLELSTLAKHGENKKLYYMTTLVPSPVEKMRCFTLAIVEHGKPGKFVLGKGNALAFSQSDAEIFAKLLNLYINNIDKAEILASASKEANKRSDSNFIALVIDNRENIIDRLASAIWQGNGYFVSSIETIEDSRELSYLLSDELEIIFTEHRQQQEMKFLSTDSPLPHDFVRLITQVVIEHIAYFRDDIGETDEITTDSMSGIIDLCIDRVIAPHTE